jgi:hypothetical protein
MRVLQAVLILAVAAAPAAAAAAAPAVRPLSAPTVFQPWHGGERHAFWRDRYGDGDFGRRHRHDFIGPIGLVGPEVDEAAEPEEALSPFVVSAPVFVNVTLAPSAGPPPGWSAGPKLIEIGRSAPPRRPLPLVIYGD